MYLEAVEIVADWLKDGEHGVNNLLLSLPLDAGEADRPPQIALIQDEARDDAVILRKEPIDFPAIYVLLEDPILVNAVDPTVIQQRIEELPISIRYITRNVEPVSRRRHTMYTLRAILKSMNRLNLQENEDARGRNQICLDAIVQTNALGNLTEKIGNMSVTGAVIINWSAVDIQPR